MNTKIERVVMIFACVAAINVSANSYTAEDMKWSADRSSAIKINFDFSPGPDSKYGTNDDEPAPLCSGSSGLNICDFSSSFYSNNQIKFSSGTPFQGNFFPGKNSNNHFISSSPLIASFSLPVNGISVKSYSNWTAILWAFDASNNVIASDVLVNHTQGNRAFFGKLMVFTNQPIAYFKVLAEGCHPSNSTCDHILNLDDLVLTVSPPTLMKTCSIIGSANWRDTILVPQFWTAETCNQYRMTVGATNYQLGCIFDNSFSFGVNNGGKPSPNCGW
jgi:hypothetical protein